VSTSRRDDVDVVLRDVTMRDGLQDESPIDTDHKVALFDALVAAGVRDLELTSFVRADRIPALADAEQIVARTGHDAAVARWGLVLNRRGAERALAAGLDRLQFVYSVSETHNLANAGRTVSQSQTELADIVTLAHEGGAVVEVTLATAFGCPFEHAVAPGVVLAAADAALDAGVDGIGLADTIGTGVPTEVGPLTSSVVAMAGATPVGAHLHDTRGLAIANALAALDAGAARLDGSVAGLGGCPYAPGATGNVALEDLAHALGAMGVRTGIDLGRLIDAARLASDLVGRSLASHVGLAGARFTTPPSSSP
jgi:hydroxymethylglutaryl-CoA lyase